MKTSLVIMAAGIGSRFGGGIKQLTPIGKNGELIIDYSIYDAIEAGFNKIIFILRKDIFDDFMDVIGNRVESVCHKLGIEVLYAFQSLDDIPAEITPPNNRKKPWGTGHAVLAAKHLINEPFVVINADDYYGKVAFKKMHDFIVSSTESCMAGFILKNTLSENGGVTRGVCEVSEDGYLNNIEETYNIKKDGNSAISDGKIINLDSYVSMNMWGLHPEFLEVLDVEFLEFLKIYSLSEKEEFLLPKIVGKLLCENSISVKVLHTSDKWVGVTYQEDKQIVIDTIKKYIEEGLYPQNLYEVLL